jgi:lipopolysaccharide transport system permease protein
MSSRTATHDQIKPVLVVQAPTLNLLHYLYRTLRAAKYVPSLAKMFLRHLYRETVLGWWWLIFRAVLPTLGIIVIFQHVPALRQEGFPYPLFVISGMLFWTAVTTTLLRGVRALQYGRRLFAKLTAPKLIYLIASGSVAGFFSLIFVAVLGVGIAFEYFSSGTLYLKLAWPLLLAPAPLLVGFLLCLGICSFFSVATLVARDARYVLPVITQVGFYVTPIFYTLDIMPPNWQTAILFLNPLAPLLEFFRWTLFGVGTWDLASLTTAVLISLAAFLIGARFLMYSEWALSDGI